MNTEDQLRQKFARLVPDAPDTVVDPRSIEGRGRTVRAQRTVAASIAGAAVLAAVLVPLALRSGAPHDGAADPASATPDPFTTSPCPDTGLDTYASEPLPTDLVSVRFCDVGTLTSLVPSLPKDALVTGLPDLVARLESLPAGDPAACMAVTPAPPTAVMVFTGTAGEQAVVPVMACALADVSGTLRDALGMRQVLLEQLAGQRRELERPSASFDASDLCAWRTTEIHFDPAVESISKAALCGPGRQQRALDADELQVVQDAWRDALSIPGGGIARGCEDRTAGRLVVLTDYGDIIRFTADSCLVGFVQSGSVTGQPWRMRLATDVRP
ncbi:hypothetical protein [Nocardioides sp.]|uniref:hypothetical protein n=1 Tax=Nocardioides sp. TaxID=35761 RepID=UPI003D133684